jgi:hypothetical protein
MAITVAASVKVRFVLVFVVMPYNIQALHFKAVLCDFFE